LLLSRQLIALDTKRRKVTRDKHGIKVLSYTESDKDKGGEEMVDPKKTTAKKGRPLNLLSFRLKTKRMPTFWSERKGKWMSS
jgi:hypothetical protein